MAKDALNIIIDKKRRQTKLETSCQMYSTEVQIKKSRTDINK